MRKLITLCLLIAPFVSGCDTIDSHTARQAQVQLPGLSKQEFYTCAGVPNRTQTLGDTEYDTYDFQPYTQAGFGASLPLVGSVNLGTTGNCHATVKIKNDQVTEIDYAGDTGSLLGHVADCVSIVSHCMDGAKEATGRY